MPDFITIWANAIAAFEGFTSGQSQLAVNNNNPGNLKYAGQPGAIGQDASGYAIFPNVDAGFQALYNQLNAFISEYPTYSILQITAHYLGQDSPTIDSQGNAFSYATFVAGQLGVDPSTTLSSLAGGDISTPAVPTDDASTDTTLLLTLALAAFAALVLIE